MTRQVHFAAPHFAAPHFATCVALCFCATALFLFACGNDVPNAISTVTNVGVPCDDATECGYAGAICVDDFPGGYCTLECPPGGCPAGTACAQFGGGTVCAVTCTEDADCRNGYECEIPTGSAFGICDPASDAPVVDAGSDSGADVGLDVTIADTTTGDAAPGGANYGSACEGRDECVAANGLGERCLADSQGFPDGYCSAGCAVDIDECGADALCVTTSVGGLCMAPCEGADECRRGYDCCAIEDSAACVPEGLIAGCVEPGPGPGPDPAEGAIGDGCESDDECSEGPNAYCFGQVPGGYCTAECDEDVDCGAGNLCADLGFGPPICVQGCDEVSECRDGLGCCDVGFGSSCLPSFICR